MLLANGNLSELSDTGYTRDDIRNFFANLSRDTGASVEAGDEDKLIAKLMGEAGFIRQLGGNPQLAFDAFRQQYMRRGSSFTTGSGIDSSTLNTGAVAPVNPIPVAQAMSQAIAGNVITMGAAANAPSGTPTGPTGTLYAPQTYRDVAAPSGFLSAGFADSAVPTWAVLAAGLAAAWFLFKR